MEGSDVRGTVRCRAQGSPLCGAAPFPPMRPSALTTMYLGGLTSGRDAPGGHGRFRSPAKPPFPLAIFRHVTSISPNSLFTIASSSLSQGLPQTANHSHNGHQPTSPDMHVVAPCRQKRSGASGHNAAPLGTRAKPITKTRGAVPAGEVWLHGSRPCGSAHRPISIERTMPIAMMTMRALTISRRSGDADVCRMLNVPSCRTRRGYRREKRPA
jgi:hypothetical protein